MEPKTMTNEHHAKMLRLLDHQDQMSKARQEFADIWAQRRARYERAGLSTKGLAREETKEWTTFLKRKGLLK
jgi:hypothetical protein